MEETGNSVQGSEVELTPQPPNRPRQPTDPIPQPPPGRKKIPNFKRASTVKTWKY